MNHFLNGAGPVLVEFADLTTFSIRMVSKIHVLIHVRAAQIVEFALVSTSDHIFGMRG